MFAGLMHGINQLVSTRIKVDVIAYASADQCNRWDCKGLNSHHVLYTCLSLNNGLLLANSVLLILKFLRIQNGKQKHNIKK